MTKLQTQAEQNKSNTLIFSTNMYQFVPTLVTLFWFFKMGNQLDTQSGYILIHFDTCKNKKKRANTRVYTFWYSLKLSFSGERGIRTPGPVTVNGFQDRRIRPLCHLSNGVQKYAIRMSFAKSNEKVFDSIPKPLLNHSHPSKYQYDTHCLIFGTQFDPQTPTCIGCNHLQP